MQLILDDFKDKAALFSKFYFNLYITGQDRNPIIFEDGQYVECHELETSHEEADVMMTQRVLY